MEQQQQQPAQGVSIGKVIGLIGIAMAVTMIATLWIIKVWLFPKPFQPVVLNKAEEQQLEVKLARLENPTLPGRVVARANPATETGANPQPASGDKELDASGALKPEAYSEVGASREIRLSEREINAMIAKNTDLGSKVAVDLADNLISAKVLIPMDPDFPFIGGKTMRIRAGVELAYREQRPVVIVRGISIMGVPMPNAWLGGLKDIDLIKTYGNDQGFWKGFADGVETMKVQEGTLQIVLKK